ncbi:MAG: hypothetical protein KAZ88_05470 [Acidimicrobiia bacterium]|nr:hypothetical protein [Acidimicrobiia bacterium]
MNLEPHDIPDLAMLSENDQIREVYAWAGRALYYAQVLEYGLVNLMHVVFGTGGNLADEFSTVDEFLEVYFRKTLGRLANEVRQLDVLDRATEDQLDEALRRRNFLAHSFFKDRAELFVRQEGCRLMLIELRDATELFISADFAVTEALYAMGAPVGLTREAAEESACKLRGTTGLIT